MTYDLIIFTIVIVVTNTITISTIISDLRRKRKSNMTGSLMKDYARRNWRPKIGEAVRLTKQLFIEHGFEIGRTIVCTNLHNDTGVFTAYSKLFGRIIWQTIELEAVEPMLTGFESGLPGIGVPNPYPLTSSPLDRPTPEQQPKPQETQPMTSEMMAREQEYKHKQEATEQIHRHEVEITRLRNIANETPTKMPGRDKLCVVGIVCACVFFCTALITAVGGYYWSDLLEKKDAFEHGYEQQFVRSQKDGERERGEKIWVKTQPKQQPLGLEIEHGSR